MPTLRFFRLLRANARWSLLTVFVTLSLAAAQPATADIADGERALHAGDYAVAYQELLPAATAGSAKAQYLLSLVLYFGAGVSGNGKGIDRANSVVWLLKAADQNYGKALESLGAEFREEHNYEQAFDYSLKAARADGRSGTWTLAFMYCFGEGVPRDSFEADAWQAVSFQPFTHNVAAWQGLQCEVGMIVTQDYLMTVNRRAEELRREYNLPSDF